MTRLTDSREPIHELESIRQVPRRRDLASRTHCKNGHEFTAENTGYRKDSPGARLCLKCKREKDRQAKERGRKGFGPQPPWVLRQRVADSKARSRARLSGLPIPPPRVALEENLKTDPLLYLKLSEDAAKAETDFGFAVERAYENDEGLPLCFDKPEQYTDYDERDPPTRVQAALMCVACPVFEQCSRFAEALKPVYGVYAGERWTESNKIGVGEKVYK